MTLSTKKKIPIPFLKAILQKQMDQFVKTYMLNQLSHPGASKDNFYRVGQGNEKQK